MWVKLSNPSVINNLPLIEEALIPPKKILISPSYNNDGGQMPEDASRVKNSCYQMTDCSKTKWEYDYVEEFSDVSNDNDKDHDDSNIAAQVSENITCSNFVPSHTAIYLI